MELQELRILRSMEIKAREVVFEGNSTRYHFHFTKVSGTINIIDINNNIHFQLGRHLINEFDINYYLEKNGYGERDREVIIPHFEYFLLDF